MAEWTTGGRFAHVKALRYLVVHLSINLLVFSREDIFQNIVLLHRNNRIISNILRQIICIYTCTTQYLFKLIFKFICSLDYMYGVE